MTVTNRARAAMRSGTIGAMLSGVRRALVFFAISITACGPSAAPAGPVALVCPAGSTFDGTQCVRNLVVTNVACPTGSTWDGAQCVGTIAAACGGGLHYEEGRGCVANAPPSQPAQTSEPAPVSPQPMPTVVPPPSGTLGPFDRGAAAAALMAAGNNARACAKPGARSQSGHVTITFSPSGNVSSAVVDSSPFAGTPEGGCIAGKFRNVKVPPFSGAPVTVGKSFSVP